MANTSQQTESGSETLLQNTVVLESSTDSAIVDRRDSTTEVDSNAQNKDEANIGEDMDHLSENSLAGMDASEQCGSVDNKAGVADGDVEADDENSHEDSANFSTESTPREVRSIYLCR